MDDDGLSNRETTPLLKPVQNRSSSGSNGNEQRRPIIAVAPVNADEQPVPLAPSTMGAVGGIPTISCRICRSVIGLEGKLGNHVVKCPTCNEATPIRQAPEGKRYVRCPCGCLLVCKQTASRISCPRDHCRRVLNLATVTTPTNQDNSNLDQSTQQLYGATPSEGQLVVNHLQCPSCFLSFLLQTESVIYSIFKFSNFKFKFLLQTTPFAKCPHCSSTAVLNQSYVRRRFIAMGLLSLIFLCGAVSTMVLTWEFTIHEHHYGIIGAWAALLLLCLVFAFVAAYYSLMKVAKVMTSATSSFGPRGSNQRYAYA